MGLLNNDQRRWLLEILIAHPGLETATERDLWLRDLPRKIRGNISRESSTAADLAQIIDYCDGLGWVSDDGGYYPLQRIIEAAQNLAKGSGTDRDLQAFLDDLAKEGQKEPIQVFIVVLKNHLSEFDKAWRLVINNRRIGYTSTPEKEQARREGFARIRHQVALCEQESLPPECTQYTYLWTEALRQYKNILVNIYSPQRHNDRAQLGAAKMQELIDRLEELIKSK